MSPAVVRRISRLPSAGAKGVGFERVLAGLNRGDRGARAVAIVVAGLVHLVVSAFASNLPARAVAPPPKVSEIELAPPPEAAPPPPPPPPEPSRPAETATSQAKAAPSAPAVARAGNVVTAKSDAPAPAEAVDFVTDPDGRSFGSGVVARGGTLERATVPTPVAPPPGPAVVRVAAGSGDVPVATENLGRPARLDDANPCAGFYPPAASADSGLVTLALVVRPSGELAAANVVDESPRGEGFGAAARACLAKTSFTPALDRAGKAVTAAVSIRVRFTR